MTIREKVGEFSAAERGYHYYCKTRLQEKTLECFHDFGPREISSVNKFLLDRGAMIFAKLTSKNYRKSRWFRNYR